VNVTILPFSEHLAESFRSLNEEWLNKFFVAEPKDIELLSDPKKTIIDPGGTIFFAEYNGAIVGTVALIPHGAQVLELGKMAVTESAQGLGVGKALLEHCIAYAGKNNAEKLFLYSNTKLGSAIHLYRKYGFVEIPLDESSYVRTNIKMELLF
jgi:ribosomal protein S18 acetylase RimI-like enzyme